MKMPKIRIGLFDSGAGGLSVLRKLVQTQGEASFIYLADTARCPYGNRAPGEIALFAEQTARWLVESGADRIVMACNTSASIAGGVLRNRLSTTPIHDLIRPVAAHCATKYKTVAVFATSATCRSGAFSKAMAAIDERVRVIEIACPELVPLVEAGHLADRAAIDGVSRCIERLNGQEVDAIVLGCTHFPFLSEAFSQLTPGLALIDPADFLQLELFAAASAQQTSQDVSAYNNCAFFTTGDADAFARSAELCLGLPQGKLDANVCAISTTDFSTLNSAGGTLDNVGIINTLSPLANAEASPR